MHCKFTQTKKPSLLLGRSVSNRHLAVLMITVSNNRKLVTRHLSAISYLKLVSVLLDIASSKCSKEMSQYYMERRPFGIPCNACDACIGFGKQIMKVIVQVIKKGKSDGTKSRMWDVGSIMSQICM